MAPCSSAPPSAPPCGLVLAKFLERWLLPPTATTSSTSAAANPYAHLLDFTNKRAVELGTGCGAAGMAISLLGLSDITLTDIAPLMPALKRNLKVNRPALRRSLKTALAYWNNPSQLLSLCHPFDFVVAADVVYIEDSVPHLISAFNILLSPSGLVLLGYQLRSPEAHRLFWDLCSSSFDIFKVSHDHLHPDYAYDETDVCLRSKKSIA